MEFRGEPAVGKKKNTLRLLSSKELKVSVFQSFAARWGWGGYVGGGSGLEPGVRSKCVIVTKLTRKSRGGQCADRTLGCMIHRKGPEHELCGAPPHNPPSPSHPCCQPPLWNQ